MDRNVSLYDLKSKSGDKSFLKKKKKKLHFAKPILILRFITSDGYRCIIVIVLPGFTIITSGKMCKSGRFVDISEVKNYETKRTALIFE